MTATVRPNGQNTFLDSNGDPLAGGLVYTYATGTTTPLPTFADAAELAPNPNPIVLDSAGRATIFWDGIYKVVVRSADGSLTETIDPLGDADSVAAFQLALAGTGVGQGSNLVSFAQNIAYGVGTAGRKLSSIVSPTDAPWNAKADGVTDDSSAIQACIDANPNGEINFGDGRNVYKCASKIVLTSASGRNFQGDLTGKATITFTNAGNYGDTDAAMQHGFEAYPIAGNFATSSYAGEVSGWRGGIVRGLTINSPTNGAGFYLANCQRVSFDKATVNGGRYGIATECCIHVTQDRCTFSDQFNAGIGWINSGDQARVNYAANDASSAYWNDSPSVTNCGFGGNIFGALAFILDMGSTSESIRRIHGNYFFTSDAGHTQYGYLGRGGNPVIGGNWFENIQFPICFLSTNATSGGPTHALTGVTNAQPNSTYTLSQLPDTFSYTASIQGNFFARGNIDIDVSGVVGGTTILGGNIFELTTGYNLYSTQSGSQLIVDLGNSVVSTGVGYIAYKALTYGQYVSVGKGTTAGDNAPAGSPGEYISQQVLSTAAVALTTAAISNVASIVLTAGDWDLSGAVGFNLASGTSCQWVAGGASTTSVAFGNERDTFSFNTPATTGLVNQKGNVGPSRFNLTATTTIYLVAQAQFSGGTCSAYGSVSARRVR